MNRTWQNFFIEEKKLPYAHSLKQFLDQAYQHKKIYPPRNQMYRAFDLCPVDQLKVVIIGQDPYHQPGQANGLAFSVNPGIKLPPSLLNIYKEISVDLGFNMNMQSGDLTYLAKQGVLLLNSLLTVEDSHPLSHQKIGYEIFFEHVFQLIESFDQPILYLLWGSHAKAYQSWITNPNHTSLLAHHPSPLSANRGGWFGCRHFSKTNTWLIEKGLQPIHWSNT
ncbi:MAG: uracil-DNA glycosylase [Bacilli bacterium]